MNTYGVPYQTALKLAALQPWQRHEFDINDFCYQCCRFCKRSVLDVRVLWKYGVRHYACDACREKILSDYRLVATGKEE